MWQRAGVRGRVLATVIGAATVFAPALMVRGEQRAPDAGAPASTIVPPFVPMTEPGHAMESGLPPASLRLRAIVARAWDDAIATWKRLMEQRAADIAMVNLRFVTRLAPNNCYGLYNGEGPAYCSGNRTVFVGTDAASRLMAQLGPEGEAGITFLIGHEIGHHIQNLQGRFQTLNIVLSRLPAARPELMRRFELEADCFAGVWIHSSQAWASSGSFRAELLGVLDGIGDDKILAREPRSEVQIRGIHGTSEQRRRWFLRGADHGDVKACNTFSAGTL
jgi:uncharacterized protein